MKNKGVIIITFLILIGLFSVTISLKDFFFTTKFYQDPMSAYNADSMYSPIYGDTTAKKTIGLFEIDEEKALFIAELSNSGFLVAEMNIKDAKYAYEGTVILYNSSDSFNEKNYNLTETKTGSVKWTIAYSQQDVEKLQNVELIKEYSLSTGSPLFLIVFKQ